MSYINPFMISRHLNPRASGLIVFGGGGGDAAPAPVAAPAPTAAEVAAANKVEADRRSAEEKAADEAAAKLAEEKRADAQAIAAYKAALGAAEAGVPTAGLDALGVARQQLSAVTAVPKPTVTHNPEQVTAAFDAYNTKLQGKMQASAQQSSEEVASGQRELVKTAITDPAGLTTPQNVAAIDPNAAGTNIAVGTGQLGNLPTARTSTVGMPGQNPFEVRSSIILPGDRGYDPRGNVSGVLPGMEQIERQPDGFEPTPIPGMEGRSFSVESGELPYNLTQTPTSAYDSEGKRNINYRPQEGTITPTTGVTGGRPLLRAPNPNQLATAAAPTDITTSTMDASTSQPAVTDAVAGTEAAQGTLSDGSTVTAATMTPTDTAVSDLTAAQGEAIVMDNPVQREIQQGELISGAADATKAAAFTEQIQAATATPSDQATVKGQLTGLMQDFEGGATPPWAAGALRNATAAMAARGLGASSMAGQALVQAAMESAIPIAAQDAQTVAGFEMANLSNRQQRAMLAAEQRATFMGQEFDQAFQSRVMNASKISDVANMNFTAEQQVALENSRNANTMNMANLSNRQAMAMGEAAAISNLEMANLSNQQQAAVQNAQAFLQMDMTNLNNLQQTEMFKAQSVIQSIFTDQAAENASKQFNASSENQTKQFMSNMRTQVNQFNASQSNAMSQFNVSETNAMAKFNTDMKNQRDQFNSTNQLVIAQANAQWRQNVSTTNTTAQNVANAEAAKTANAFTASTLDQIWQRERDMMSMAWKSSESAGDRANNIILSQMSVDAQKAALALQAKAQEDQAKGGFFSKLLFYGITGTV